ncbi:haloacid dehalogenase type II [Donghicola mangrovi]|uniref:(S)-2-haloacid dehalogenase n=1 Tax=Donghicola mangrovi TaxID=2729614 RepID=A0A850Q7I0_9RHOB|nr:haloacid dehalogenase type II [Donghicola mangrovi]NVO25086.1 haloacid dehalogenase type II [Donghicola mangrovi]
MTLRTCIFDAYGTLFDVAGAARQAASTTGGQALAQSWPQLAERWRAKQLEYTWLRAITGAHTDFWQVTQDSLDWSLEALKLSGDEALRSQLLDLYRTLPAYPEVPALLQTLNDMGVRCAILSNGSLPMLEDAVNSAGIAHLLDSLISVEEAGVYKPDYAVYDLVGAHYDTNPLDVLFVSSNGWDAAGAAGYGFNTLWVNRMGVPVDRMPWRPRFISNDLTIITELLEKSDAPL